MSTQTWYPARVCVQLIVRQNDLRLDLRNEKTHLFIYLPLPLLPLSLSLSLSPSPCLPVCLF